MSSSSIEVVIKALDEMQNAGIIENYAIGGAFAAILHSEPISTIDLDIFFFFKEKQTGPVLSLEKLYDFAKTKGFTFDHEFINIDGWLLQFIESSDNPLWAEAVEDADKLTIGDLEANVIGREHLVAMWLFAGRAKDYQKITMFVDADILDHEKLTDILTRHDLLLKWEAEKWRFTGE
ncbi:MAG: hypothetical protein H0V90_11115 [Blastocatellia bacterium]|nr:hypothetical protein [Blastocatellia bacterium]